MEIWKVSDITLLTRPTAGRAEQHATMACLTVAWTASNDHGADCEGLGCAGYLLTTGLDVAALQALPWQPRLVRFLARGAMEEREFEIGAHAVEDAGQGVVRFPIP